MFRQMIFSAALAGLVAALFFTLAQSQLLSPLILKAETYEQAAEAAPGHREEEAASGHHHDEDAWKPQDGIERILFTIGANTLMGIGYALVLTGLYMLRRPASAVQGLLWGLAGFIVFFAAPGLGLPPELPGTKAAELTLRQQWWVSTAAATAAGLALLILQSRWWLRLVGVAVLIAPHYVGAPQPALEGALAPPDLQLQFRLASLACNALFWIVLGLVSSVIFQRFNQNPEAA